MAPVPRERLPTRLEKEELVMTTAYEAARAAFDKYAAMDAPHLPDDPWSALQVKLTRWQTRNFGIQPAERNALGIAEELGEMSESILDTVIYNLGLVSGFAVTAGRLAHTVLKNAQKIRGMDDMEKARHNIADGVADLMVFSMQLCTCFRLDMGTLFKLTAEKVLERDWTKKPQDGGQPT